MRSTLVLPKHTRKQLAAYRRAKIGDAKDSRQELLCDLANLQEHGLNHFWRRRKLFASHKIRSNELLQLRDQLRDVWRGDLHWLDHWLMNANRVTPMFIRPQALIRNQAVPQMQLALVNPLNLHLQLFFGIVENGPKLVVCGNPNCPAPYFLRYKDARQQFCDREECLGYGQRQHKRIWWQKNRARAIK
jgi:hypothetical protein